MQRPVQAVTVILGLGLIILACSAGTLGLRERFQAIFAPHLHQRQHLVRVVDMYRERPEAHEQR